MTQLDYHYRSSHTSRSWEIWELRLQNLEAVTSTPMFVAGARISIKVQLVNCHSRPGQVGCFLPLSCFLAAIYNEALSMC